LANRLEFLSEVPKTGLAGSQVFVYQRFEQNEARTPWRLDVELPWDVDGLYYLPTQEYYDHTCIDEWAFEGLSG
jgi:hypothetical protein